jgi:transcriptional regulator with XRE-family HTH domain
MLATLSVNSRRENVPMREVVVELPQRTGIGDLVRSLRDTKGWTQARLHEATGLTRGYISRLEAGEYDNPSSDTLLKLARALDVPLQRLVSSIESPDTGVVEGDRPVAETVREAWRTIENALPVEVPVWAQAHSAGTGAGPDDEIVDTVHFRPPPGERHHRFLGMRVVGHCMEPSIHDGHTVIYDTDARWHDGDVVVVRGDDRAFVRRVELRGEEVWFVPDNPKDRDKAVRANGANQVKGVVVAARYGVPRRGGKRA